MNLFLISDPHFSHENIIRYCNRPFASAAEMDEVIVERWNSVVRPQDHVYCLGDVAMKRAQLSIVKRLNGHKRLLFGNHDIYDYKEYVAVGFKKLAAYRVLDNCILSHIPISGDSLGRFTGNIHGHVHDNPSPVGPYLNVCVEKINYTPIPFEQAKKQLLLKAAY